MFRNAIPCLAAILLCLYIIFSKIISYVMIYINYYQQHLSYTILQANACCFFPSPVFSSCFFCRLWYTVIRKCGDIVQLGERLTGSQEVRGSNPLISTKQKPDHFDRNDPVFYCCNSLPRQFIFEKKHAGLTDRRILLFHIKS